MMRYHHKIDWEMSRKVSVPAVYEIVERTPEEMRKILKDLEAKLIRIGHGFNDDKLDASGDTAAL
jgi:hypothetical protein